MPNADGKFVPTFYSLSAERWEQIFGKDELEVEDDECDGTCPYCA